MNRNLGHYNYQIRKLVRENSELTALTPTFTKLNPSTMHAINACFLPFPPIAYVRKAVTPSVRELQYEKRKTS